MKFISKTASPNRVPRGEDKPTRIKALLFEAVLLQIEDDAAAREELLALLQPTEPESVAS